MYSTFKTNLASVQTLSELLQLRSETHPDAGYDWLDESLDQIASLSLTQLERRARAIAQKILEHVDAQENVFLMYPPGLDFIEAFFGCMYAGVVAVPTYPSRGSRGVDRARAIVEDSSARLVLTVSDRFASASADGREQQVIGSWSPAEYRLPALICKLSIPKPVDRNPTYKKAKSGWPVPASHRATGTNPKKPARRFMPPLTVIQTARTCGAVTWDLSVAVNSMSPDALRT